MVICIYSHSSLCTLLVPLIQRILGLVEDVLNVVEVTPNKPFEFAAPAFGVRVEDPPADLGGEESFTPNITSLLSQIMNSSTASKQSEEAPELTSAMVTLASTLLRPDGNSNRPQIVLSVYGRDTLFQERPNFTRSNDRESQSVGSIVCEIFLRLNRRVVNVLRPPDSNVVRPSFRKSMVSLVVYDVKTGLLAVSVYPVGSTTMFASSAHMQLARNNGRNTTCQFWNFTTDGKRCSFYYTTIYVHAYNLVLAWALYDVHRR